METIPVSREISMLDRLTKPLKNQKGLTLIELLAIVVILGVIALIAIPSIGGIINNTKKNSHRANAQIIVDAARYMVINEGFNPDAALGTVQNITYEKLLEKGFLEKEIKDPQNSSIPYAKSTVVRITQATNLGYSYEINLLRTTGTTTTQVFGGLIAEDAIRTTAINSAT
jgi:type IV pilus assembly protein PilA